MPSTPITTDVGEITSEIPRTRVFTADTLDGPWEEQLFLYVDEIRRAAAPTVESVRLAYDYGTIIREPEPGELAPAPAPAAFDPLALHGKFVKCVIIEAGMADGDDIVWYGIVETDERLPGGNSVDNQVMGTQEITAFGLLRLLERTFVRASHVHRDTVLSFPSAPIAQIGYGLGFNAARHSEYSDRGNRSESREGGTTEPYIFSDKPRNEALWTAFTAAEYVLKYFQPVDSHGDALCAWALRGDEASIDWYDISVETDQRSVKAILDDLIDHKRGVGYFLSVEPAGGPDGTFKIFVDVFTFVDLPLLLKSGKTIPANPNQRSLDFEEAFDVDVRLVNSITSRYDTVIAYGEWKTSTFTLSLNGNYSQIETDWTDAEEETYRNAASDDDDYDDLDTVKKRERNTRSRQDDHVAHVFRRFIISPLWNQTVFDYDSDALPPPQYYVAPPLRTFVDSEGNRGIFRRYDPDSPVAGEPLWTRGLHLEHRLPLKDRFEYGGEAIEHVTYAQAFEGEGDPEYLAPLFFVKTGTVGTTDAWEHIEKLSQAAVYEGIRRVWSAHARMLEKRPGFEITVCGRPQHFLSPSSVVGAAAVDPQHDPAKEGGIEFSDIRCTLCARLDSRVEATAVVAEPEDRVAGRQDRVLLIHVKDARLDYVVPTTTVAVVNSTPQLSSTGGFVRDDRPRLRDIARAAAEWYGRPRQTIQMTVKQVKEFVSIGWLITQVGAEYKLVDVNTPITAITYNLRAGTTEFETAFAEVEFS